MVPIFLFSVVALAITLERIWTLRIDKIVPKYQVNEVWKWIRNNELDGSRVKQLRDANPLGRVLAAGLTNAKHGRQIMKESIEEVASHVIHDMEKYMSMLGTIAVICPLLGLLGTVFGMIDVFTTITTVGTGDASALADGISTALITTAAGLCVGIPALMAHRFLSRRIDSIAVNMEQEAVRLIDALHGERETSES